jgi:hypothetical protein
LETLFLADDVMDVLGIMYPQYWLHLDFNASFVKHLVVIKVTFCYGKIQWVDA